MSQVAGALPLAQALLVEKGAPNLYSNFLRAGELLNTQIKSTPGYKRTCRHALDSVAIDRPAGSSIRDRFGRACSRNRELLKIRLGRPDHVLAILQI